jgi:drug/metabolite transporter (DMT)-like permease
MDKYKLAIIVSGILLGPIGVLVKLIDNAVPVTSIIFFRMLFATLFAFLILAPVHFKELVKLNKKEMPHFIIAGLFMTITFTLYMAALLFAPVANVALISATYVIIVPIIAFFFLKEKLKTNLALAIVVAILGAAIINPFAPGFLLGNSIAFLQAIVFAFLIVYMRKEEKSHDVSVVFWFFLFALLASIPLLFIYGLGEVSSNLHYLIILGLVSTTLPYLLLSYGLQKTDASTGSVLILVMFPLASIIFAYLILSEIVAIRTYAGGALLIIAGLITLQKWQQKRHFFGH